MTGSKSDVATQIRAEQPKAVLTHFYGHSLNLACADAIKHCKVLKDALETIEITKLIKMSPRRNAIFRELQQEISPWSPGIRLLCPTRWTV